jgi:predicted MFS family arabinose efflux permease
LSFIIGVPLVGLAIARSGWQAPFPFLAGFGIVAIIVLFWLLPKDQPADGKKSGAWRNLHSVFTFPPALAGLALGLAMSGSNEMVNVIFSVWMEDAFQVKIATLATASVIIGVSELGAEGLVSLFTDRLGKARAVGIGLALNSLALLALPVLGSSLGGALAGLFLLYLTFEFTMVSSIPLMSEVLPTARATLMAVSLASSALGRSLSDLLSPLLYNAGKAAGSFSGMLVVAAAAALLNLVALAALSFLRSIDNRTS